MTSSNELQLANRRLQDWVNHPIGDLLKPKRISIADDQTLAMIQANQIMKEFEKRISASRLKQIAASRAGKKKAGRGREWKKRYRAVFFGLKLTKFCKAFN